MNFSRVICRKLQMKNNYHQWKIASRSLSSEHSADNKPEDKSSGYAKAFTKFEALKAEPKEEPKTFAALLRQSKFIELGDPEGKVVIGKILHTIEDDLYIDFGWKFHCVCPRPSKNGSEYVRGAKVRLLIKDLELSTKFLGYDKDLTLLESDCLLLGLVQDRRQNVT